MHKQAINHKQAIIGGGYLFTENACYICFLFCIISLIYFYVQMRNSYEKLFCDSLLVSVLIMFINNFYRMYE